MSLPFETASQAQLLAAFEYRAACRNYDAERKIPDEEIDFLLDLARLSPSSVGSEPWQFLVLQNPEIREKLRPVTWGIKHPMEEMSHLIVILAKKNARFDSEFFRISLQKRGLTPEQMQATLARYEAFQRDDMGILDNERALFDWCCKQTYIALGNLMTAAALRGIDTCPIEGLHYASVDQILADEGLLDPNEYGVSCMLTLGYRGKPITRKYRKAREETVRWVK